MVIKNQGYNTFLQCVVWSHTAESSPHFLIGYISQATYSLRLCPTGCPQNKPHTLRNGLPQFVIRMIPSKKSGLNTLHSAGISEQIVLTANLLEVGNQFKNLKLLLLLLERDPYVAYVKMYFICSSLLLKINKNTPLECLFFKYFDYRSKKELQNMIFENLNYNISDWCLWDDFGLKSANRDQTVPDFFLTRYEIE